MVKTLDPICFGVMCPQHGECERYQAINGDSLDTQRIGTCKTKNEWPLFLKVQHEQST